MALKFNPTTGKLDLVNAAASGAGSGDVVGPASATDEAFARYNLTTGKLIQNSVVTSTDIGATQIPFVLISDTIQSVETVTIPTGKQMIVGGPYSVDGTLVIEGTFWVL